MPGCGCPKPFRQPKEHRRRGISWGKCGDNIKYGEKKAKRFTDRLEKGSPAIRAVNLHNNEVGRQVKLVFYQKFMIQSTSGIGGEGRGGACDVIGEKAVLRTNFAREKMKCNLSCPSNFALFLAVF